MIIELVTPLPCGTIGKAGVGRCGNPATVASALPTGSGEYLIMPICKQCSMAMAANYGVDSAGKKEAHDGE
jgi:hypothetical protein